MGRRKNHSPDIHLNLNVRGLPISATLAINEKSIELRKQGRFVYKLGLGQSPFPVPQSVVDALKVNAHQKDYQPVKGLYQLREAVADYYRRTQGITHDAEDVIIGPGSKELMFLLQLVYYGDLVIPTPSWVSYAPQAHIIGRHVRWLPTNRENDWKLTADELSAHCSKDPNKPRIVILNYPSNPAGTSYTVDELKAIARVAFNHKIILLSDEIYGELHHRGKHISVSRFYPEGTIISGGLSKWCGAGGWRLGTFTFPRKLRWLQDAIAVVASETYTATSAPIQYGAVRAFKGGIKIENYLWNSRIILRRLGRILTRLLREAEVSVAEPDGAFYLFPDFSPLKENLLKKGIRTSDDLCNKLLDDTGVAILPGSSFGRPQDELTARIAYVDFDGVRAISAAEQLKSEKEINEEFLELYCGNTIRAIELLYDWLKN